MEPARQIAWLDLPPLDVLGAPPRTIPPDEDEDASLRSGSPAAIASQASLWREEPTRMVGHSIERLQRPDGVGITICHTHRREVIGWGRRPCS